MGSSSSALCQIIESDRAYLDSHQCFKDKLTAVILHDRFTRESRVYTKREGIWEFDGIKTTQEIYGSRENKTLS